MLDPKTDTLLTIYETRSFTKAAQLLQLTQPAVSRHIKQLEEELGARLFIRGEKELRITEEGEIAVKYARRMRVLHQNLIQSIKDIKSSARRLTIGVTPTAESNIMSEVFAEYCSEKDDRHITIISDDIKNLYTKLKTYEIDLAIVEGKMVDGNFNSILLDTDYLVLAVSNSNSLANKSMVTLNELKRQKLILRLPNSGTRSLFESHLESNNESIDSFNVILEVDNIATIKDLVRRNFGVSILAKSACMQDAAKNKFKILPVENLSMIREVNIIYHKDFGHTNVLDEISKIYYKTMRKYG